MLGRSPDVHVACRGIVQSPAVDATSDDELLHAWRAGDARAADVLVRRHSGRLLRFFRSKVGALAEDLCQQTWIACVEARDRIEDESTRSSFAAYLFGTARNRLFKHLRRHYGPVKFEPLVMSLAVLTGGASLELARKEERARLTQALHTLPLDAQIALELHYWEQLSVREISEVVGAPEGTIKARLSRARQQLHTLLHGAA